MFDIVAFTVIIGAGAVCARKLGRTASAQVLGFALFSSLPLTVALLGMGQSAAANQASSAAVPGVEGFLLAVALVAGVAALIGCAALTSAPPAFVVRAGHRSSGWVFDSGSRTCGSGARRPACTGVHAAAAGPFAR